MAPHRARRTAWRIQQNGIEQLCRLPIHDVRIDPLCIQLCAFQIGHQPVHAPGAVIKRGHGKARSRKLHRLAAGGST